MKTGRTGWSELEGKHQHPHPVLRSYEDEAVAGFIEREYRDVVIGSRRRPIRFITLEPRLYLFVIAVQQLETVEMIVVGHKVFLDGTGRIRRIGDDVHHIHP